MGEIRRFYVDFLHRPLEEYQKFTAYTSPWVGLGVAFWCDAGVMGMTVPLSGFVCNALGLAERQQQKIGSVLISCKDKELSGTHTATCS